MSSGVLNDDQLKRALKQLGVPKEYVYHKSF